ncbi:MAG: DUF1194 domain-containing protein [Alphaproteobacteria bacterium]|nr:DUF1194 domain-containing protein [Alphaproteobacteria bacterium]
MSRRFAVLLATLLLAAVPFLPLPRVLTPSALAQDRPVDVHLVLAVDSSSSVTMDEYYLQLEGYAKAFAHPELWAAIRDGAHGAVAVALFEWAGAGQQVVNFEWRVLDSEAALQRFAGELALAPRLVIGGETALGEALLYALALLETAPGVAARRVIDISGDGESNRGIAVAPARAEVLSRGVVINGLPVVNEVPGLAAYYADQVIGGHGSFVLSARDYDDFRDVILRKLVRELRLVAAAPHAPLTAD